jgi:ATP-dependent DNA helicase 2 subunit 1
VFSSAAAPLSSSVGGATLSTTAAGVTSEHDFSFLGGDDDGGGAWNGGDFDAVGRWEDELASSEPAGRDALIFLIDARQSMLVPLADGTVPLAAMIDVAATTLSQKIIENESDLVGVAFFGCQQRRNANDFEHVYVFAPLDRPGAELIIQLETMARSVANDKRFELGSLPAQQSLALGDVLWTCSTMFSACTLTMAEKRVFLFTDDDAPCSGSGAGAADAKTAQARREQALQRTKDLTELKVSFYLYPITRTERAFDTALFFDELMRANHQDDADAIESYVIAPSELLDELRTEVRKRAFKRRALTHFTLRLGRAGGHDVEIGVDLYSLVQEARKSTAAILDSRNLQAVRTDSRYVCEDTGTLLLPSQMQHAIEYGGERVVFSSLELQTIKRTAAEQGLEVLGFKPRAALKFYHNIKHSAFLFPNEAVVKGGTRAFVALVEQLAQLDRVAICLLAPRANAPPRIVALLPQREECDAHGNQLLPCGLCVVPLPFADDIRRIEFQPLPTPPAELRTAMKAFVKSSELENIMLADPALQKHYVSLQAIALERDSVLDVADSVKPDPSMCAAGNKDLQKVAALAFPPGYVAVMPKTPSGARSSGVKRQRPDGAPSAAAADRRPLSSFSKDELAAFVEKAAFKRYTVPELKAFLQEKRVPVPSKATKDVLANLVITFSGGVAAPPLTAKPKTEPTVKKLRLEKDGDAIGEGDDAGIDKDADNDNDDNDNDDDDDDDDGFNLPETLVKAAATPAAAAPVKSDALPPCKYGATCWRKNELHLKSFFHPPKTEQPR